MEIIKLKYLRSEAFKKGDIFYHGSMVKNSCKKNHVYF